MTDEQLITPTGKKRKVGQDGTSSPIRVNIIVDLDLLLDRLKRHNDEPPLTCIRMPNGIQCTRDFQSGSAFTTSFRESLAESEEFPVSELDVSIVMGFLHCKSHWISSHRGKVLSIWKDREQSFKESFMMAAKAFIEWFYTTHPERCNVQTRKTSKSPAAISQPESLNGRSPSHAPSPSPPAPDIDSGGNEDPFSEASTETCTQLPTESLVSETPITSSDISTPSESLGIGPGLLRLQATQSAEELPTAHSRDKSKVRAILPKSNSEPTVSRKSTPSSKRAPVDVDGLIEDTLIGSVTKDKEDTLTALVYVFKHTDITEERCTFSLKIGQSLSPEGRKPQVSCRELTTVFVRRIKHAHRVEKLAQKELTNFQRLYRCCNDHPPPSGTTEWFEIGEDVAIQVVERWCNFMMQEPYEVNGELKGFWQTRLTSRLRADIKEGHKERFDSHDLRHERWQAFVSATDTDRVYYHLSYYWKAARRRWPLLYMYRWQMASIYLALRISWTASSPVVVAVVGFWIFFELVFNDAQSMAKAWVNLDTNPRRRSRSNT